MARNYPFWPDCPKEVLVKLAIDGENRTYAPRVDANQFLTVAKQFYGLDPPD